MEDPKSTNTGSGDSGGGNESVTAQDKATAEVKTAADKAAAPKPAAKTQKRKARKTSGGKEGYVDIMLEENDEIPPSGLFIGVNDRSYLLQPGMEASVPPGVVDVLDNAVQATPRIDPQTKRVVGYKERLRYPYRRL